MGEKEDREKAEKLAAAKKRVAQLQKRKKAAAAGGGEKSHAESKPGKDDTPNSPVNDVPETAETADNAEEDERADAAEAEQPSALQESVDVEDDEAVFSAVIAKANKNETADTTDEPPETITGSISSSKPRHGGRQPSVSLQSKLRSTSFRDTTPGPISPNNTPLSRIQELERENKRLADEAAENEARWRRAEENLEELREETVNSSTDQIAKLRAEIELLKRQKSSASTSNRRLSSSQSPDDTPSLRRELESKDSTIADMQLEISRLRSQLSSQTSSCDEHGDQISALTASLSSSESKARALEAQLAETKKALSRAAEKAVLDGTERTSKELNIRNLERDLASTQTARDEALKRADQLTSKIDAMTKLHRESEARSATRLSSAESIAREIPLLRAKVSTLEAENARLREKHKRSMSGANANANADEGLDELEDEERKKLARRIRDLEAQVFDLQRGIWRDKRTQLQPDIDTATDTDTGDGGGGGNWGTGNAGGVGGASVPLRKSLEVSEDFDEVDLSGGMGTSSITSRTSRRTSSHLLHRTTSPNTQAKHSNFSQYITSGLNAFLPSSSTSPPPKSARARNDSLLQDFDDDDIGFDEAAFSQAAREEEAKKMLEHVKEVKRGLNAWKGWRLDLVDARRGEGGWEVFEV